MAVGDADRCVGTVDVSFRWLEVGSVPCGAAGLLSEQLSEVSEVGQGGVSAGTLGKPWVSNENSRLRFARKRLLDGGGGN